MEKVIWSYLLYRKIDNMRITYNDLYKGLNTAVKTQKEKNNKRAIYKEYGNMNTGDSCITELNKENTSLIISNRHAQDMERQAYATMDELSSQNKLLEVIYY